MASLHMHRKSSKREESSTGAVYLNETDFVALEGVLYAGPITVLSIHETNGLLT